MICVTLIAEADGTRRTFRLRPKRGMANAYEYGLLPEDQQSSLTAWFPREKQLSQLKLAPNDTLVFKKRLFHYERHRCVQVQG